MNPDPVHDAKANLCTSAVDDSALWLGPDRVRGLWNRALAATRKLKRRSTLYYWEF